MAAKQLIIPGNRAFNSNGFPESGAVLKFYVTGTLTPLSVYTDAALTVSAGASVTANGAGRFDPLYADETVPYRLRVLDAAGAELDDIDPIYFGASTDASTSATNAANSASAASTSATNAAISATAASGSATSASGSATAASTSATNAANSATAAATSATDAATSATGASSSASTATAAASAISAPYALDGYDALNGSPTTVGDTTPDTTTAATAHNFGGSAWTTAPMVVTSLAVRLSAIGTGVWEVVRRDGRVLKKIASGSLAAGLNTYSGFTPFYVPPGHAVFWRWISGGNVRFVAAGAGQTSYLYDGNIAEGSTASLTVSASLIAVSMSGTSFADTPARQGERLNAALAAPTIFGSTAPDSSDLSGSYGAFSAPTTGPSIIDQVSLLGIATAGGAPTPIVIVEPVGNPGSSSYKVIARLTVTVAPGVYTYDIPPVYAPKAGSRVGAIGAIRFATSGSGVLMPAASLAAVGSIATRDYTTVPTIDAAVSCRAWLLNTPPETPSYADLHGPTPLVEETFSTAAPKEWSLLANVTSNNPGLKATGATISDPNNWAVFQRYSSANYKRMGGRFKVADATGAFALMMQPYNGGRGIAVVADGTAGTLRVYILDNAGGFTAGPSQALTAALVAGDEYSLVCSYASLNGAYTLTSLRTGKQTTITDNFASGVHNRNWHGRPVVALTKSNLCYEANFYADRPRYIRTIILGDSRSEGVTALTTNPSWAHTLADNNPEVLVSARAGDLSDNARINFAQDVEAFRPKYVVLALGANETSQATWRANMTHMIQRTLAIGATPILQTIGPYAANQTVINTLNADILASYFGNYAYIDEAAAVSLNADRVTVDPAKYYSDGIHYIAAGVTAVVNMAKARVPYAFRGF
jgi:hypothetical protein